jgi:cytochrome P450 family 4
MVIKESMRIYPPVPFVSRFVPDGATLGQYYIPKGQNTSIGIYLMHNDPKYFPEPNKFIPERFDRTVDAEKFNPYTYIPFSAGPRNCIGQKFAMLEIKLTIAKIVQNFTIVLQDETFEPIFILDLVLKAESMPIKFVKK